MKLLFLIILSFGPFLCVAQDSLARADLVITHTGKSKERIVFHNAKVKVYYSDSLLLKGRMLVANDSTIIVDGASLSISEIQKIGAKMPFTKILGGIYTVAGISGIYIGGLLVYTANTASPQTTLGTALFGVQQLLGYALIAGATCITIVAICVSQIKHKFSADKYNFRIRKRSSNDQST